MTGDDNLDPRKSGRTYRGTTALAGAMPMPGIGRETHLPNDNFLPHLAFAVDGDAMRHRLQSAIFGNAPDQRIESCKIERVKYHPAQRCTIGYRLSIRTGVDGVPEDHFLTARLFEPGGASARFERYRSCRWIAPRFGPPLLHLAERDMILWSFPNDRHLPALPLLTDESQLRREAVPELVERHFGRDWSIISLQSSLVSYVHERRCSARLDLTLRSTGGDIKPWSVFGKTAGDDSASMSAEDAARYWQCRHSTNAAFVAPKPLGTSPDGRIDWQEVVAGEPLTGGSEGMLSANAFQHAGAAIAALHGSPLDGVRTGGAGGVVKRLGERAAAIDAWPAIGRLVRPIVDRLFMAVSNLDHGTLVAGHGDLHGRNILIDGERVVLIDLDEAMSSPPARDLGHFAAYTHFECGLDGKGPSIAPEVIAAFIDGYVRNTSNLIRINDIAWHAAAALVTEKIFREVSLMQPERQVVIERLIALADRLGRGDTAPLGVDLSG